MFLGVLMLSILAYKATECGSDMMTGGKSPMSPEDIKKDTLLMDEVDKMVELVNEGNTNLGPELKTCIKLVLKSVHATSQVVQGVYYDVTVEIGPASAVLAHCTLGEDCTRNVCKKSYICTFNVWSRPWLKDEEKKLIVSSRHCEEKKE